MTKPASDADARWLGFLLAALVAALVTLLGAGTASAATATAAQTPVGPHTLAAQVLVGPGSGIGAGQRLGNDLPAYDSALATGVAAKAGGAAAKGAAEVVDVAARRGTLRVGTKRSVLDAQRAADGKLYDPNTGGVIAEGSGQFGHRPGFEWWRTQKMAREQGWTRQRVIEFENNPSHYSYEDASSNMSHVWELPR